MEKLSLSDLVRQQLEIARGATSGRSAHTLHGGHGHVLRQTLLALAVGGVLAEHDSPGEATVQVLHGRVRLSSGSASCEAAAGDLLIVPTARHSLEALDDSVVLLTVGKHRTGDPASDRGLSGHDS